MRDRGGPNVIEANQSIQTLTYPIFTSGHFLSSNQLSLFTGLADSRNNGHGTPIKSWFKTIVSDGTALHAALRRNKEVRLDRCNY
jgi:hypothetical protein